ncbi:laminin subunit alpha-3 [Aplysia californica]|uniref:Laminin subunit alpha-3 n=1 Tax=Aplysia californica TaxID=6500 RepID=A0ABM1A237_APLCA|nr:laminin subunit alpha-3 [Aplysia californica]
MDRPTMHLLKVVYVAASLVALLTGESEASFDICMDEAMEQVLACQPTIYDVASGANTRVSLDPADATCGSPATTYRRLGDRRGTVETCDANDPAKSHPITNLVDSDRDSWWQSVNQSPGTDELRINITLSFQKVYRLAGDIIITFNSGRPNKMILEKSVDYGQTWTPLQYYARNCAEFAAEVGGATITEVTPSAVICTNRYVEVSSRISAGRTVKFATQDDRFALFLGPPPGIGYETLYNAIDAKMLDFLLFTDLRMRLFEPATDGRANYDMYYYGISQIQVVGRCFCNLHASNCNFTATEVVCDCVHNTQGKDCESCLPLYNERPWQRGSYVPYDTGSANECRKCECNDHALSCTYDASYGRGVCDNCLHNTTGRHCELCQSGFYPNLTAPVSDVSRCLDCACEGLGVRDSNFVCSQTQTSAGPVGQCPCKDLVAGRQCNRCTPGYYGLYLEPSGTCKECLCDLDGTEGQSNTCEQDTGQCPCKVSVEGQRCDTCADGFFAFPRGNPQRGCLPCQCNLGGSLSPVCDKDTGKCQCRTGVEGDKCDRTTDGNFVPAVDVLKLEPQGGACALTSDLWTEAAPFDGSGYVLCDVSNPVVVTFEPLQGAMVQRALQWQYYVAVRYSTVTPDLKGVVSVQVTGNTAADLSQLNTRLGVAVTPGCPLPQGPAGEVELDFVPGSSTATLSATEALNIDARCQYTMTLRLSKQVAPPSTVQRRRRRDVGSPPDGSIHIDSMLVLPALTNVDKSVAFQVYSEAANSTVITDEYRDCLQKVATLKSRDLTLSLPPCEPLLFSVAAELYDGSQACQCDATGSLVTTSCQDLGGQCVCQPGVSGRVCDVCVPGYYNFSDSGCIACACHPEGSETGACDYTTGQCPCRQNVALRSANGGNTGVPVDGTCSQCVENFYGIASGQGCSACLCNGQGSVLLQCDQAGQCPCKDSVQGEKCDACKPEFFGFGPDGCSMCNCSSVGATSPSCDLTSGVCDCKKNVEGNKCDNCRSGFFNLVDYNPDGCQPCFCFNHGTGCASAPGFQLKELQLYSPSSPEDYTALLGDQHVSYGRLLTLWLEADYTLDISGEMLATITSGDKHLHHLAQPGSIVSRDTGLQYEVRLFESEWILVDNFVSKNATAADVLGVLADVTAVSHVTKAKGQDIRITYMALESAEEASGPDVNGANVNATFVEECTCNIAENVAGLSCETCATGFRRPNPTVVTPYDTCLPCDCNGRGATDPPECNELSGICLNCRNGTTGDQCQDCAGNVIGPECDTCQDQFWGLDADGCQECNCSSPGSQSPVCDQVSGQCVCADHVVGRVCDQCQENYHNLTITGCIKCETCYDEVVNAITPLRSLRDDISANVTVVESQYDASVSPVFIERLRVATADTEKLINFLTSAQESELEVGRQIGSLSATLTSVETQLSTLEGNKTSQLEAGLAEIEGHLQQANTARAGLESRVTTASTQLASLETSKASLSDLLTSLQGVLSYLSSLADANSADAALIQNLRTLNETTATANRLVNEALQKAQSLNRVYQNTTSTLLTLESTVINVVTKAAKTLLGARSLATSDQTLKATVVRLQAQLAELTSFVVDENSFLNRANAARGLSDSYRAQVNAGSSLFSPTNLKALETVAVMEEKTNQTMDVALAAGDWSRRSSAAEQKTLRFQVEADKLFADAQNTLNTLNNFAALSLEAQTQANASLERVSSVHDTSKRQINESRELSNTIALLRQLASAAKDAAQQAVQVSKEKQQQLLGVLVQSEQLQTRLKDLPDRSQERYTILDNTQDNIVAPAAEQRQQIQASLNGFSDQQLATSDAISLALSKTAVTSQKAGQLLSRLRSMTGVDSATVQQLIQEVRSAQSSTSIDNLRLTIDDLRTARSVQRAEIDRLKALKDNLKVKIESLVALQAQISGG